MTKFKEIFESDINEADERTWETLIYDELVGRSYFQAQHGHDMGDISKSIAIAAKKYAKMSKFKKSSESEIAKFIKAERDSADKLKGSDLIDVVSKAYKRM